MRLKKSSRNLSKDSNLNSRYGFKSIAKAVLYDEATGNVLVIRRSNTDTRRPGQWDIPGGTVEDGETLEDAVVRECIEEVGIILNKSDLSLFFTDRDSFNQNDGQGLMVNWLVYYCPIKEQQVSLSFEHDQYKWVLPKEAIALMTYHRYRAVMSIFAESKLNQLQGTSGP